MLKGLRKGLLVLYRIYVPPDDEWWTARQTLRAELAWQPYLYTAIFFGVIGTLIFGDPATVPPIDSIDNTWMLFGVVAPLVALVATLVMRFCTGRCRYAAFWLRLGSNIGLASAIITYRIAILQEGIIHPLTLCIHTACVLFLIVLIVKDLRFLHAAEKLAQTLRDRP